jgi:uncharacterized protein YoxC
MPDHNCQYPDLKEILKELSVDMKVFVKDQLMLLEANMKNSQLVAIAEIKEKQAKVASDVEIHDQKIEKLFKILDEVRTSYKDLHDSYQQVVGMFKLWGFVVSAMTAVSTIIAIYMAFKK